MIKVHSDCVRRRTTSLWGGGGVLRRRTTSFMLIACSCLDQLFRLCTVMNINEKKYELPLAESLRRRTT
jgi:hypothetical protein